MAAGSGDGSFVAVATSRQFVRLFSNNGVALDVFSIDGPIVTMAAHENLLMIVSVNGAEPARVSICSPVKGVPRTGVLQIVARARARVCVCVWWGTVVFVFASLLAALT